MGHDVCHDMSEAEQLRRQGHSEAGIGAKFYAYRVMSSSTSERGGVKVGNILEMRASGLKTLGSHTSPSRLVNTLQCY